MKSLVAFSALAGLIVLVQARSEPPKKEPEPKPQIDDLKKEIKALQELVPDQAAIMSHLGYHWSNLWFAIDQEHWTLADFYLSETRSNLKWAVRAKPFRKVGKDMINLGEIAQALDNAQLTEMKQLIAKKDRAACAKLYEATLSICYGCHKASDKPYLRPQRPVAPEARMINFDPKAKEPQ
jgi:hypothetical protein